MARITTRDCERYVLNRFELVLLAAERAHQLWNGAEPQVPIDGDKPTVLALREIAAGRLPLSGLRTNDARRHLGHSYPSGSRAAMLFRKIASGRSGQDGKRSSHGLEAAEPPDSATDAHGSSQLRPTEFLSVPSWHQRTSTDLQPTAIGEEPCLAIA